MDTNQLVLLLILFSPLIAAVLVVIIALYITLFS
jgi:hypothetical protein